MPSALWPIHDNLNAGDFCDNAHAILFTTFRITNKYWWHDIRNYPYSDVFTKKMTVNDFYIYTKQNKKSKLSLKMFYCAICNVTLVIIAFYF